MNLSLKKAPAIAVIGHLVTDEIIMPDGSFKKALGGTSYNLASMGSVIGEGRILPVCVIGDDIEDTFNQSFGSKSTFDTSFVKITEEPNVINRLVYTDNNDREEWNSRIPEKILLSGITNKIDAALFNFISGDDVEIDEILEFKDNFDGPIYFDFHSLALGRDGSGKRYLRRNEKWREYVSIPDLLQMNHCELSTITSKYTEEVKIIADQIEILHECGPQIVIVTLGVNGAIVSDNNQKVKYHLSAINIDKAIDPTGCGDTFASVFFYEFFTSNNLKKSALKANLFAAAKASFSGIDGFRNIIQTSMMINSNYNKCEKI